VTVSPPVSPNVVAAIFMIQKIRVTSGTLLAGCSAALMFSGSLPIVLRAGARLRFSDQDFLPPLYRNN
jgi:hypothetical protein